MEKRNIINIIGAGLAGSEAALYCLKAGAEVRLYEMRPVKTTPAHKSDLPAELVCSNSFRSQNLLSAAGLLKAELMLSGSELINAAIETAVPAGTALASDREGFSQKVYEKSAAYPKLKIIREEVTELKDLMPREDNEIAALIIAAGPLASENLKNALSEELQIEGLRFFDAAAPLIEASSIDMSKCFKASRWQELSDEDEGDYLNLALNKEEYESFVSDLLSAEKAVLHDFDEKALFEGCLPVENLASRGIDTLRYGPLKPFGLKDPKTGEMPYAVIQLRRDDAAGELYNMVGFQTRLSFSEQKRVFSKIPALAEAVFARYGMMHKNTYIDSPQFLNNNYALKGRQRIYFAGQITGVEGYLESAASGLLAAASALAEAGIKALPATFKNTGFSRFTMIGALGNYVANSQSKYFAPMKSAFGIIETIDQSEVKALMREYNLPYSGKQAAQAAKVLRALKLYNGSRLIVSRFLEFSREGHKPFLDRILARESSAEEKKSAYYYHLPPEMIAQHPADKRDNSRLMVLDQGEIHDRHFSDIKEYLKSGDLLVINNTKVIPARLIGRKSKGSSVTEILLLKRIEGDVWECVGKPGKNLRKNAKVDFPVDGFSAEVKEVLDNGNRLIEFKYKGIWHEVLDAAGTMPLPHYIKEELKDPERYNTVYAKIDGSAAAPTAGLHFTPELLKELQNAGVEIVEITLHVGLGTFRPVKEDNILNHQMHSEHYEISEEAAAKINKAKEEGRRVIAVGTTSCRTLETAADLNGHVKAEKAESKLFIYPGYQFKVIDALLTNFHLPESTLLMLVSALYGRERILDAYEHAVENNYRFFSFGDAMLILP